MKQWAILCVGILAILAILVAFKFQIVTEGHSGGGGRGGSSGGHHGGGFHGSGGRGFGPGRGGRGRGWNNYGYGGYGGGYGINPLLLDYYGGYDGYYDPYWTPLRQRAVAPWVPSPWNWW